MGHLFSYAFRPLFALAIIYALVAVPWWALAWGGYVALPLQWSNPIFWHAHEMVFGFAGAAIGGFALTAVSNWTRRPPVAGVPLQVLCGLWLVARISALLSGSAVLLVTACADLGYFLLLGALFAREVIAADNRRNFKLLLPVALLTLADACFYWAEWRREPWVQETLWAGVFVIILLVTLIGGRIVPAFTGNWLVRQAREKQMPQPAPIPGFGVPDALAAISTVAFALSFLLDSHAGVSFAMGLLAVLSQGWRLSRWRGWATLASPLVWMLHAAYLWIPVGLALLAMSCMGYVPASAGFHALTTGGIVGMVLAVASRAALGHTNRPLRDHPLLTASYVGVHASAICRVVASVHGGDVLWLNLAALCWLVSMSCFAWRYLPILLGPPRVNS